MVKFINSAGVGVADSSGTNVVTYGYKENGVDSGGNLRASISDSSGTSLYGYDDLWAAAQVHACRLA